MGSESQRHLVGEIDGGNTLIHRCIIGVKQVIQDGEYTRYRVSLRSDTITIVHYDRDRDQNTKPRRLPSHEVLTEHYPRVVLLRIMLSSLTNRFAATSSFSSFVSRVYSASSFFIPLVSVITRPTLRVENETEIYWKATSREEAAARVMTLAWRP